MTKEVRTLDMEAIRRAITRIRLASPRPLPLPSPSPEVPTDTPAEMSLGDLMMSFQKQLSALDSRYAPIEKGVQILLNTPPVPGPRGEKGDAGVKGERGEQGPAGRDGKDGKNGRDGVNGHDGKDGRDGARGDRGEKGETGERGLQGARGEKGDSGAPGPHGATGAQGPRGVTVSVAQPVSGVMEAAKREGKIPRLAACPSCGKEYDLLPLVGNRAGKTGNITIGCNGKHSDGKDCGIVFDITPAGVKARDI